MLTFDEVEHKYWWGTGTAKRLIPSVTQIMKACSIGKDYSEIPVERQHFVDKARRRGSAVHQITELIDKGLDPDMTMVDPDIYDDVCRMVDAWAAYCEQQTMPIIEREILVYYVDKSISEVPLYAGQVDVVRKGENGGSVVEEIKTSATLSQEVIVQLMLYRTAYVTMKRSYSGGASAVRLGKDGTFHPWWLGISSAEYERVSRIAKDTIYRYHNWEVHKNKRGMKRI